VIAGRWLVILVFLARSAAPAECLPSGRAIFAAGLEALSRGDLQTAEARFEELVTVQPKCAEARNNLAVVLFELGRTQEADAQLRQAVEINPDYWRGRLNLRRVEGTPEGPGVTPQVETALTTGATVAPSFAPPAEPASTEPSPTPWPMITAPTAPVPARAAVPAGVAALEPQGATAGVIDMSQQQLCVYRRAESAIVQDACYPIVGSDVDEWPQWVVPSDVTTRRVRLVDDTLRRRLRIIPTTAEMDDSIRVRVSDFDILSKTSVPWRTGFVVLALGTTPPSASAAAQSARQVREALGQWRQAWEEKKFDVYVGFYGAAFVPHPERDVARWRARKQALFGRDGTIRVQIAAPSIFVLGDGSKVITVFDQRYRATGSESRDVKALRWERQGERWLISAETILGESGQPLRRRRRRRG